MVAERTLSSFAPDGAKQPLGDEAVEERLRAGDLRARSLSVQQAQRLAVAVGVVALACSAVGTAEARRR
jgi:hypothetical protein